MQYIISASILTAKMASIGLEVEKMLNAGVDQIHLDVMDNHFVPNLTFGPWICNALRDYGLNVYFDVHLMAEPVDDLIFRFADAGAQSLTVHFEAIKHLDRTLNRIKELGCKVGLAINPTTSLNFLDYAIELCDEILIMTVNPGFGGQKAINYGVEKVKKLNKIISSKPLYNHITLAVDGGINANNILNYAKAGIKKFILGAALYKDENYNINVNQIRKILNNVN